MLGNDALGCPSVQLLSDWGCLVSDAPGLGSLGEDAPEDSAGLRFGSEVIEKSFHQLPHHSRDRAVGRRDPPQVVVILAADVRVDPDFVGIVAVGVVHLCLLKRGIEAGFDTCTTAMGVV
jgi:hypothetical protein